MTISGMDSSTREPDESPPAGVTARHVVIGALGLALLAAFAMVRLREHTDLSVLGEVMADLLLRDLGIALLIAVLVAHMFDKGYHEVMFISPIRHLRKSVDETTTQLLETTADARAAVEETARKMRQELAERDRALKERYDYMVAGISLLSQSDARGVVAIHERGKAFISVLREAVNEAEEFCWIVGRTHKEMLGREDEGKGWLVKTLDDRCQARPDLAVRILLANPFDPLEAAQEEGHSLAVLPRTTNAAREPLRGFQEARKTVYHIMSLVARHRLGRRVDVRLMRRIAVPYCMLMTERRVFVEHYLPSREGGALSITEFVPEDRPREQAPYACFRTDFEQLFEQAEACVEVLERFRDRKVDQFGEQWARNEQPDLEPAIVNAHQLVAAPAPNPKTAEPASTVLLPSRFRRNWVRPDQQSIYAEVIRYVRSHEVSKAIVVQYSAVKVEDVLIELIAKNAEIDLYVQSPEVAAVEMEMQSERIKVQQTHLPKVLQRQAGSGLCRIYEYIPRATLRAILIPGQLLAIGPYIYQASSRIDVRYPEDKIEIKGHDAPGMLVWHGSPEYEVFEKALSDLVENFKNERKLVDTIRAGQGGDGSARGVPPQLGKI